MIKLLSIDGSTTLTGYSVFKIFKDGSFKKVCGGVINPKVLDEYKQFKTKPKEKKCEKAVKKHKAMEFRCNYMIKTLMEIADKNNVSIIVMEDVYSNSDIETHKWLSRIQGAMMGYAIVHNCQIGFMSPNHWRKEANIPIKDGNRFLKREELKKISLEKHRAVLDSDVPEDEAESGLMGLAYICEHEIGG